jgi:hypothetical protein
MGRSRYGPRNSIVDVGSASADHIVACHVLAPVGAIMSATPSDSLAFDDGARLRAKPAASWSAILAGAIVAVSLSLILVTLGAGLGFAAISPWSERGLSASGFTVASTIWLIVTQWLSAAVGGYLAGRLRQRWLATHTHEVFFRDTAHGLVTWAVATLFVAGLIVSSMANVLGGGARAVGGLASAGGQGVAAMARPEMSGPRGPMGVPDAGGGPAGAYNLDKLFRSNSSSSAPYPSGGDPRANDSRGEVMHITANAANGTISDEDRAYLASLVASKTGLSAEDAQKRVDAYVQAVNEATVKAKAASDEARKAAAQAALFTALALLIGAFIASVSAAIGGRLRDEHL